MALGRLYALPGSGLVLILGMTLGRRRLQSLREAPPRTAALHAKAGEARESSRPAAA
jgi:hypothetical protein